VKPASWHQAQENMNERCNLSQLNALFTEGKTHTYTMGPKLGPQLFLVLWPHFWVQILAFVLGRGRSKLTAAHIRDTVYIFHHISTLVKKYSSFVLSYAQLLICDQGMLEE
jgi:hypothetical protein